MPGAAKRKISDYYAIRRRGGMGPPKRKYVRKYQPTPTRVLKENFEFKKVRYSRAFTVTVPAVGSSYEYVVSAASCHEPDLNPAAPHQPMNWDQYATFYGEYFVVGSKATLRSTWANTATGGGVYVSSGTVAPVDGTSGDYWSSPGNAVENGATTNILSGYTSTNGITSYSNYSANKYYGVSTQDLRTKTDVVARTDATPIDNHQHVFRFEALDTAASAKVNCLLTIEYMVCLMSTKRNRAQQ